MNVHKYWFKPKRYGYGATPSSWEGWVVVLLFIFLLIAISLFVGPEKIWFYVFLLLFTPLLVYISQVKTDGDWRWRWGK
ncbi:hypothetical protein H6501_00925 [Candidatus Woesearchaeota archaeon]|nr:hypothetical protein [Nanoarchaeota archaeon]MCB9370140.1 hypothetical protein [Candidatus Woesearchaeota archaeon]USN44670.1 MAG: hypothetical protein H6500_02400 [Candidatus Woesearchaeota archaeon]